MIFFKKRGRKKEAPKSRDIKTAVSLRGTKNPYKS